MPPYCVIPRDYLSDSRFLVSQHGQLGAIPPPPFLSVSPLESMRSGGAIPPSPPSKGVSQLARYPKKTRQMGANPPSAILSRKGIARYGGVSRIGPLRADRMWVFGDSVKSARGAIAIFATATTLQTCLERPFTRAIANEALCSKQQK